MKHYIKNAVASLLILVFVLSAYIPTFAVGQPSSYSSSSNSGERDVDCTTLDGTGADDYYTGSYTYDNLSALSSGQLLTSLRTLMTSTHKRISTYANCRDYADETDCENNDGRIVMLYTSYSGTYSQYDNGNGWNREHVWPQSIGGGNTSGGGADMHHIRPSEYRTNNKRGNNKYGKVTSGSTVTGNLSGTIGGTFSGGFFEPLDNVKGDVARICLYVYVRWGSAWGADNITEVFQSVDVLLEWCEMDPVDTWEMGRNEVVESIQGNRNVFIDYPELAWLVFGREVPSDMTTPSGEAQNGSDGQGGNQGGTDTPVCQHTNTEVRGFVAADCCNKGYTGDVYCKDCGEKISSGSQIPTTNVHSFGEWTLADGGVTYKSSCTKCGATQTLTVDALIASIDSEAEKILILLTLGVSDSALLEALSK